MDTDINNYDTIELLNVLKIPNHKEPQLLEIYNSAKNIIQRLNSQPFDFVFIFVYIV